MGCFNYPERRAVGICPICRRGVCSSCQVIFKGRVFCEPDAEITLRKNLDSDKTQVRRGPSTLAATLAFINGGAGGVVGFLLLILGLTGPQAQTSYSLSPALQAFFTYFSKVIYDYPASQAIVIGLILFMIGIVDLIAGILLLRRSRVAAIFTIGISILWVLLIISFPIIWALAGVFTYGAFAVAVATIGLLGLGWKRLGKP